MTTNLTPAVNVVRLHEILDGADIPVSWNLEERLKALVACYQTATSKLDAKVKQTSRQNLLEQLAEDRNEILLLLADACLDEPGREEEAKGWAWLGQHHKWPTKRRKGWYWYQDASALPYSDSDTLPGNMQMAIYGAGVEVTHPERFYPTHVSALEAVVKVIASGKYKPETSRTGGINLAR